MDFINKRQQERAMAQGSANTRFCSDCLVVYKVRKTKPHVCRGDTEEKRGFKAFQERQWKLMESITQL